MITRAKWAFWSLVLLSAAVMAVPSIELLETAQGYYRFLTGFEPGTLRPTPMTSLPASPIDREGAAPREDEIDFVEFRLSSPKAGEVRLAGNFTQWERGSIAMNKRSGGLWEVIVPLPPGRYHYEFVVDGKAALDPANPESESVGARRASVRVVRR